METLSFLTIKELKKKLQNKELSHEELLNFFIERFKHYDGKIGSALEIFDKDSILKELCSQGSLEGIPGILKDNIAQEGRILSCASKMLENFKEIKIRKLSNTSFFVPAETERYIEMRYGKDDWKKEMIGSEYAELLRKMREGEKERYEMHVQNVKCAEFWKNKLGYDHEWLWPKEKKK